MNLSDLRGELATRASETDDRHGDLLPGVRRRITTTKRRRAAGAVSALLVAGIVASGIVNGTDGSEDLRPVQTPPVEIPKDVTQHDITFPGIADGDRLQQAVVGDYGRQAVEFDWTPTSTELTIRPLCTATSPAREVRVTVDDLTVLRQGCNASITPVDSVTLRSSDTLWLHVGVDEPVRVRAELIDAAGRPATERQAQIGVGLYTTGPRVTLNAMPSTPYPPNPGDEERDGIRYRGTIGGDALEKAAIGGRGESSVSATYFPTTLDLVFRTLCLAEEEYVAAFAIDGKEITSTDCGPGDSTDAGTAGGVSGEPGKGWPDVVTIGAQHTVTLQLRDRAGRPARSDRARLAFGIYRQGPAEVVGDTTLPSLREVNGYLYELSDLRTADARSRQLTVDTPGGTPYLVTYGSTAGLDRVRLALEEKGESGMAVDGPGGGLSTLERTARPARTATLRVLGGTPSTGTLILAIYTPVR